MERSASTPAANDGERERTLPLNVLLKGRRCLLVGAGAVACRKATNLLAHGARVTFVGPEAVPEIRELAARGVVALRQRRYDPSLLTELDPFLVYAVTDDDALNRRVVRDARWSGLLASSATCWQEGDFISPSVIRWGRGQVSVTTEGASCRQAKFMRLRLEELLGGRREFFLLGVDQRALGLEAFERVRPDGPRQTELIGMLRQLAALEEFVLLATCNRLELLAWTRRSEELEATIKTVLGLDACRDRIYVKTGEAVLRHAANVVAGHFSAVICETQITGQFKAAFRRAFDEHVAGVHMQNFHDRVLTLGKRIRGRHSQRMTELPEMVADAVGARVAGGAEHVLLLGAGGLGREVAGRLAALAGIRLTWGTRSPESLPAEPACARLALDEALADLARFDQVVTVLGASEPVVRVEHVQAAVHPPVFLDLGLPRNVDPQVAARTGAKILDLSHFRHSGQQRERLVALAKEVVLESGGVHG